MGVATGGAGGRGKCRCSRELCIVCVHVTHGALATYMYRAEDEADRVAALAL
jgi:hypothetical protein